MKISEAKKKAGVQCCAYACDNKPVPKKGGLCDKHYARKLRQKDPVGVRYTQFKVNAKKRGFVGFERFSVTLEQFRKFCFDNGYIIIKGRRGQNATIDRRCNIHGYHIWNMCILSNRANASKGNRFSGENFECPF
jgi:hypothetical protein